MAYSGSLLKINNTKIIGLKEYKISYAKLWSSAERLMSGRISATLIGIFPKLQLVFRDGLSEDQVSQIINLLDQDYFNVTYFDPKTKGTITAQYYASDYDIELLNKSRGLYKAFSVNLIPVDRRS